ncbi:uncharacterized protein LOC111707507 isoform X2 [Eurytemora carolleeae]|uniref:uncharacterized protein LOC111707507 isoform X2 n=1 Tax=Eurytemora carolleeae TaxID=1294199 RepID=UPI000C794E42|nr:uncharacterized protein LOC111707507 isoform X2 [Eurytemora carolleeae]|eukprot:XP_023336392.1 uncharacterized protein LOC111707507 isoform X2 [Eurytemora affinis]
MGIELLGLSLESSMESLDLNDPKRIRNHVTDVSMDSNGGSQDGSKLYKNSNEGSEDGSESYKDSNEGSEDGSESFKDSNEGSEDVSESNKDSNEESQDGSGFSKDSNQESDEGSKGCMSSNERCKTQIGFSFDSDDEESSSACEYISSWLARMEKRLDFIYDYEEPEYGELEQEYLSGTDGKICDPYVLLRETDERIEEMRSLRTYKPINLLRGRCFIKLKDGTELQGTWRQGRREGPGVATTPDLEKLGVLAVSGNYRDGVLQGLGRVHMLDESIWDGWFLNGKLHGPVRGYCKVAGMIWLGYYGGGSPTGPCWRRVEGGSWLIGTDGEGGGDSTYLYPDLATALVGRWRNGQMISAYPARLKSWEEINGVCVPNFQIISKIEYRRWISSSSDITCPPHQPDIYEQQFVRVIKSRVEGGGEGLVAVKDIQPGTLISFYNGVRFKVGETIGITGYGIYNL